MSNNKSNICCISTSEFISTKATISLGISATTFIEIEKLQDLLINRKDDIDDLLKSQPVYAIGIDFLNDSIRPCISCWVVKPLDISILECLEDMFENQFDVIYQISVPFKNNSDLNLSEPSSSRDIADNYISSEGSVYNSVDPKLFQKFTISARLRAKISPPNLEYEIDVYLCKTGKLLSSLLPRMRGCGYYLDSVEVCVSPIPCTPNNTNGLFISKDTPYPQQLNRTVEFSDGRETNIEGQFSGEIGSVPKISVQAKGGVRHATNTKSISNEWVVSYCGCHTTGDSWSHRYVANDNDVFRRTCYVPERHSAKWHIKKNMSGFRIIITQVLRYKIINSFKLFPSKPKLIKCPVIAHVLEITFNKLEDFNANFAKLVRPDEEPYYNENDVNIEISNIQELDGEIIINRSFVPRD
ncbi:4711_t:CDS:2 [Funneliformis mosseae]|uniref:4711_t:CDS:1 n=1 Tax=Funneliformis mosseae TaxID=27381 RepID=A0A9N9C3X4_FUNMO|nr:4711_t:CDS:2 [Funneliformis mosseae]